MTAGGSAARQAAALWQQARQGALWRRILTHAGVTAHTRRADEQARAWDVGAMGEAATARLLSTLQSNGALILHDLALPGARRANADHVVITLGARVFVVDSKWWSASAEFHPAGDTLMYGSRNESRLIRSARFEADLVSRALDVAAQPLIAVHNAPVAGQGFIVAGVPVVPAVRLLELLRGNDGPPNPAAAAVLARRAARVLRPYAERG